MNWNPQLRILYMAGFRLGPDTTRRVSFNKSKKRIFYCLSFEHNMHNRFG